MFWLFYFSQNQQQQQQQNHKIILQQGKNINKDNAFSHISMPFQTLCRPKPASKSQQSNGVLLFPYATFMTAALRFFFYQSIYSTFCFHAPLRKVAA